MVGLPGLRSGLVASTPVDELVRFALETDPGARRLPEWTGLRWRRLVGERATPYLQPVLLPALVRYARSRRGGGSGA